MPSNHLILCCSFLLLSIFSTIKVFSNESAPLISWSKYWSFRFNISPSNEHSGLISFRMDWLDLLAAQGTLKSLLQHHSSKASLVAWKISADLYLFEYYLSLPFFGIGAKTDFSSPLATAEFSKFAKMLNTELSQHHLLRFESLIWNSITSTSFVYSISS